MGAIKSALNNGPRLGFGLCLSIIRLDDGQLRSAAPVFKRAVVQMCVVTEVSRCEKKQAGLLANVAVSRNGVALLDVSRIEELAQCGDTLELML